MTRTTTWLPPLLLICVVVASQWTRATRAADATDQAEPEITENDRDHWSFRPLVRPAVPIDAESKHVAWVRNPIDAFVLKEMIENGIQPMPEADRTTLIRRLSYDLTGLPPAIEEIDRFVRDSSPDAYERLVERLLTAPAFGERWAQHWLDLARFAETDGFEHDKLRPDAWQYRDWTIAAINDDLPFDQFVKLQIAGDEISGEHRAATGFLTAGPDIPDINLQEERRHSVMNEMTSTVGSVFLGLQIGCAQCHDHKFDPISQRDFYRFRAFFDQAFNFKKDVLTAFPTGNQFHNRSHLAIRGDFRRQGDLLEPAFVRIANPHEAQPTTQKSSLRQSLSMWLTDRQNPLTTRTLANRLWLHHFGEGLSTTASDFGTVGDIPFHIDLLNWLATEIPQQAWSLKQMHRLIVTSATYRQISRLPNDAPEELRAAWTETQIQDPDNRLWSRGSRRRLEGESIRDTMLFVSNDLSQRRNGPGIRPPLSAELVQTLLKNQWPVSEDARDFSRRSVYLFVRRNLRYPLFEAFDKPDTNASCAQRNESTIAPQALMLLNSELSMATANKLAGVTVSEVGSDPVKQVESIYRHCLGRSPRPHETKLGVDFISQGPSGLQDFCLTVLNLNEFVYVD